MKIRVKSEGNSKIQGRNQRNGVRQRNGIQYSAFHFGKCA